MALPLIINFPTKEHWRGSSKLEYIDAGLVDLVNEIERLGIKSIAMPALGCSNGGLNWVDVKPRIVKALEALPEVQTILFEPRLTDESVPLAKPAKKPKLTPARAVMIKLIDFYREPGYSLGRLEVQKLAYFLQEAGQDLRLHFVKQQYGPYAENVNHVLQALEGHYIKGYGDRSSRLKMRVIVGVLDDVNQTLGTQEDARERLERVRGLIEGFETPHGMELLASVHWLNAHEAVTHISKVESTLHRWSPRKERLFTNEHVEIAWRHLDDLGWLQTSSPDVNQAELA